jgi:hypothetical protein
MLEHLIEYEPDIELFDEPYTPLNKAGVNQVVDAKVETANWLKSLGAVDEDEVVDQAQATFARAAFTNIITGQPTELTKSSLSNIKAPAAVQHLVSMLTAYDWEFIHQAQQLRGYCVAQLVEETKNPNASIRLKALTALGKVTEVGLFTEKIEIKKEALTDNELDQRIKDKLAKFMGVVDAVEVTDIDIDIPTARIITDNPTPAPDAA